MIFCCNTVNIGFRNHPPSEGSRFLNPARPLKQGSGYSNQVVTGRAKRVLFLFPLGLATTTAAILLYKSQILRFLNPRLLFMYLYYIKSYKDLKQIVNSETDYQDMNSWKKVARLTITLVCTGTLLNGWQSSNTLRRTFFPAALSALYIWMPWCGGTLRSWLPIMK